MRKIFKDILGWIVYIAILAGLIYGIPKGLTYLLKTDYPMAAITSGSMWPTLKKGDMVLIKGINGKEEVKEGDIIVYRNPKGFTIHRVIKINENTIVTKGDANNVSDFPIKYEEIIGKTLILNQKPVRIPLLGNVSILINKSKIQ
jgi:signal peptidase